jgi:hypothetical protein
MHGDTARSGFRTYSYDCGACWYDGSNAVRIPNVRPAWLYGELYQARCDFLHGNPVRTRALTPGNLKTSLFWLAPCLYRLALTGFLGLSFKRQCPKGGNPDKIGEYVSSRLQFEMYQYKVERALLRAKQ